MNFCVCVCVCKYFSCFLRTIYNRGKECVRHSVLNDSVANLYRAPTQKVGTLTGILKYKIEFKHPSILDEIYSSDYREYCCKYQLNSLNIPNILRYLDLYTITEYKFFRSKRSFYSMQGLLFMKTKISQIQGVIMRIQVDHKRRKAFSNMTAATPSDCFFDELLKSEQTIRCKSIKKKW
uniref:THAP-type domain-containing protein n=1 Tax=Heterorhabditis bacteriophora TaxID=37862 RepID=A0A1I7W5X6_HETBA